MDFTKRLQRLKKIEEASKLPSPRIKSIKLSGARLATRIARQASSAKTLEELTRYATAQSTITVAMSIVEDDQQRANRLLDMARSLANGNVNKEPDATK